MVLNDPFMRSFQPAINNLYKQYGAPYGNFEQPPDGALAQAKALEAVRKKAYTSYVNSMSNPKMTYQDAVNNLTSGTAPIKYNSQQGAYEQSQAIRNDPTMQQLLKDQGYNVNDYINALYNVSSGGKFKSERDFNQYDSNLKKQVKTANKTASSTPTPSVPTTNQQAATQSQPSNNGGGLGGFLSGLGQDLQRGYDRLIVKPVSGLANAIDSGVQANNAIKSGQRTTPESWGQIKNAFMNGYNSNTPVSFSKVLNDMGSKNQTVNNLVGGASDFMVNPLNLIPYVGAEKLLGEGGLKVGSKLASELAPKFGGTISNAVGKGLQGMATGALGASADASLNPHLTPQQRLSELLQMGSLGGIGGALGGAVEGGAKAISGRFNALDNLLGSAPLQSEAHTTPQDFLQATGEKALHAPSLYGTTKLPADTSQLQDIEKAIHDLNTTYQSKLNDHITNTRQDFINQGLDQYHQKASELDAHKALASDYKAIKDAFPKGIQIPEANKNDFQLPPAFKAKKGSATDIYQAADHLGVTPDDLVHYLNQIDQSHKLVNGTAKKDSLGFSTPEQAQKALENHFDTNLGENAKNNFHQTPDAQAIQASLDHLNQAKENLASQPGGIMRNDKPLSFVGKNENPVASKLQQVDAYTPQIKPKEPVPIPHPASAKGEDAINIDQAPQPVKLSPKELQREANKEQFATNNLDPNIPDTSGHVVSKSDIPKPPVNHGEKFISGAIDNLHSLSKFDNAVTDANGKELNASDSTHKQGLNSRSSDVTTEQIVKHGMVTPEGKVVVNKNGQAVGSLKDIIGNMKPKEFKAFNDYLVNKHAVTRMERGEKVFPDEMKMSPEKSAAKVAKYEEQAPHFKELANQVYKWNRSLLKNWLVDGGIISKEDYKKFVQANPHYVPMHRVFDPNEAHMGNNAKKGYANQSNPVKEATGSQRQIIDPIESMIEHANQYVKTVRRNEVGQAVVKSLSSNPEALKGWAEIVPTEKGSPTLGDALANKAGDLKNEEDIQNFLEQFNSAFDKKSDLTKGNIVRVLVKGKPVHLKVNDPGFLDALTNIGPAELPKWIKAIGAVTRNFKVLTTGTNPIFMVRNMTRDIPMAYANSTTLSKGLKGQAQFAKDLLSAYWDVATNKQSLQDFKNMGGGHASSVASDTNKLAKTKQELLPMKSISDLKDQGKKFATARFTLDALKRAHEKVIGGLEKASNTVETAPRLAEYKRTVKQGGGSYDSKVQGIYNANDVTVNFNRFGTQAKQIDQLVPYLNASIQGIDKFVRAAKDNPAQFAARVGVGVGLPAALAYLANANNPNYQQLPKYLKDQYFMIPRSDGTFIKIAKPREIGAVIDGIERTLDALHGDPHAWQDYGKTLFSNFLPPIQTIDAPLQQVASNTSFTGAPIVSKSLQTMAPKYQYDSKDTGFAKGAAQVLSLLPLLPDQYKSPKAIDYLLKSYGGGLAQMTVSPKQAVTTSFTADPVYSNDIGTNFYNEQAKLDQAHAVLQKKGITDPALNEPLRQQFDSQARKISKVRKAMKAVQNNNNLTTSQKKQQARLYQQMINQMESQTNALAK